MSSSIHWHRHSWAAAGYLLPLLLPVCGPPAALGKPPAISRAIMKPQFKVEIKKWLDCARGTLRDYNAGLQNPDSSPRKSPRRHGEHGDKEEGKEPQTNTDQHR